MSEYSTLSVTQEGGVAVIELNRPDKANALNMAMWEEIGLAFRRADQESTVRVVVLRGAGKHFCSGIDLMDFASVMTGKEKCDGRRREELRRLILKLQGCLSAIEDCRKPVLAALHGGCIGGGVDMVASCDMRYISAEGYLQIKEIDIGMTADVGTLQRLPHIIGDGVMRELAYIGRKVDAEEARAIGLVNRVYESPEALMAGVMETAQVIASKSPLAIRGTKEMIKYTRDHSVADSLNYVATWNAAMLISEDIQEAMMAQMQKREPKFRD
ncbi:crotonase/enoyl-CoA hydratase family protein [Hahella sp. HN01]|uniref:crotonase/enoyl-CoA hydratase family protein n=1 Tax=Hahella sp. HN01 TaxID=2847262 RepID=UPI001C1EE2BE|nr:crotonase/enoyl-CoA hydratase family protein [Hahella sp. HN01]MBU6955087.1 crotonase/enoyl-CoA hydratase family protein [Hahella sp. HN01]